MKNPISGKTNAAEMEYPGRFHPVLAQLTFVPILLIVFIALTFLVENVPLPLALIFAALVACCGFLSFQALQTMIGGRVIIGPDGLTVRRFMTEEVYAWTDLDGAKVTPATGTFGDNPLLDQSQRVGLGLFIRNSGYEREHDLDPDKIICAADTVGVQRLMQIAERIQTAHKRALAPKPRQPARQRQPNQRKEFRNKPAPAQAPADLVANFRGKK